MYRGPVLRLSYDAAESSVYYSFGIQNRKVFPRFNALSFYLRGSAKTVTVQLVTDSVHEYHLEKKGERWRSYTIPYAWFTEAQELDPAKISEIRFVIDAAKIANPQGALYLDRLSLTRKDKYALTQATLPRPGKIRTGSGRNFFFRRFRAGVLDLSVSYPLVSGTDDLRYMRFEASTNGRHWFYIGRVAQNTTRTYSFKWDNSSFESGKYYLRAVAVYDGDKRAAGKKSTFRIRNDFESDTLLEEVSQKAFQYFIHERHSLRGFIKDTSDPASYFATRSCAFGILALCIGAERGYIAPEDARWRIIELLDSFENTIPHYYGFFVPYFDFQSRAPLENDYGDISATAYLLASAIVAQQYFDAVPGKKDCAITEKVDAIYRRMQWPQAVEIVNAHDMLSARVLPDGSAHGRLEAFGEGLIAYLLAIGSPYARISPRAWDTEKFAYRIGSYNDNPVIDDPFFDQHQLPHLWLDWKELKDPIIDYVQNTIQATFIAREHSLKANDYPPEIWGITPCYGPDGYTEYMLPLSKERPGTDGTICPAASIESLSVTPELSKAAICALHKHYGDVIWQDYGFIEAFNPQKDCYKDFYTADNTGRILVQIENYRSHFVQRLFMENESIRKTLDRLGLE
jgi:hypothetical protein